MHSCMGETAAENRREGLLDFAFARRGVLIEKRLRGEDDAIQTEAALRRLLVDKSLLDGMRFLRECQDLRA